MTETQNKLIFEPDREASQPHYQISMRFDRETYACITRLAEEHGLSYGEFSRQAVLWAVKHIASAPEARSQGR